MSLTDPHILSTCPQNFSRLLSMPDQSQTCKSSCLTATDRTTAKAITAAAAAYCSEADEEWGIWRAECQSLNVAVEAASKDSRPPNANLHIVWQFHRFGWGA